MLNENETNLAIEKNGYQIIYVYPDLENEIKSFAYTVGLTEKNFPELMIEGNLHPEILQRLLSINADYVLKNGFKQGVIDDLVVSQDGKFPSEMIELEKTTNLLSSRFILVNNRYSSEPIKSEVRLAQVLWSDSKGRFAYEEGFEYPDAYNLHTPIKHS